jgi:DNA-binding transcriptional ArsR family regulator
MDSGDLKKAEQVLKALANRRRIAMLRLLKQESTLSVGAIAEKAKLSFKATSNHLALLRAADIVERDQTGLIMNYRIVMPMHPLVKVLLSEK